MSLPLVFRPVAQDEFDAAAVWYERQRVGLGAEFVVEVQDVLDEIADNPKRYPVVDGDVREAMVSRFPFCVYYRVKTDRIVVIAVFHTAINPAVWSERM